MDTFGTALRTFRSSRKLKQSELAEQIGMTRAYISQVETGTSVFSRETMLAAAVALRLTPDEVATLDKLRAAYAGAELTGDAVKRLAALEASTAGLSRVVAELAEELSQLQRTVERLGRSGGAESRR